MEGYALNLKERHFFSKNYATIPSRRGFGFKNRNFGGFFPGREVSKTIFDRGVQVCRIISARMALSLASRYPGRA